jgi:hypothetical protein
MSDSSPAAGPPAETADRVPAGCMPPWEVGDLPPAPVFRWRQWTALIGPGLMMAGANIGGGEWLFGPAVTAQYGATLMWLAALSIGFQIFFNLEVMRYTLYCGEPIVTGYFRTVPGPAFWTICYIFLDFGAIWPYLASNAAVPLAAAFLRRLPGPEDDALVKGLGYGIFLCAFLPLIFGGKIYNALEKVMVAKIALVLGYLAFMAVFVARPSTVAEVFVGFFRVGTVPLRAQTVIVRDQFTITETVGSDTYQLKGTLASGGPLADATLQIGVGGSAKKYAIKQDAGGSFKINDDKKKPVGAELHDQFAPQLDRMLAMARRVAARNGFLIHFIEDDLEIEAEGAAPRPRDEWTAERISLTKTRKTEEYASIDAVPDAYRDRVRAFVVNQGVEPVGLVGYLMRRGRMPDLNWGVLAGFAAIAGAGGLSNAQFSNYARDKGWGMGPLVGAIPSAIGGQTIELSHVGKAFRPSPESLVRWRGWFRHIVRDQLLIWMGGCFLGMALPSILSLEFIRNAPVEGNKVAAMTADGIAQVAGSIFWPLTLICGFLVLGPTQVVNMDGIIRRWTDVIWTGFKPLQKLGGNQVKYVYYFIMLAYGLWGLIALWKAPDPLVLVIASTVFMNLALGFASFHTLWVNTTLLPRELRPNWLMRIGLVGCGIFFLGICAIALNQQLPALAGWLRG